MPFFGLFSRKDSSSNSSVAQHHPIKSIKSNKSSSRLKSANQSSTSITTTHSTSKYNQNGHYILPEISHGSASFSDIPRIASPSPSAHHPRKSTGTHDRATLVHLDSFPDSFPTSSSTLRLVTSPASLLPRPDNLPRANTDPLSHPPRRSSLSNNLDYFSDAPNYPSTATKSKPPNSPSKSVNSAASIPPKRPSLFGWVSSRDRTKQADSRSIKSSKSKQDDDRSFQLKSFRHVQTPIRQSSEMSVAQSTSPQSAASATSKSVIQHPARSIPTKSHTTPGFQVTSRPRSTSVELITQTASPKDQQSQPKVTVGAFRQAARRSATNLALPPTDNGPSASSGSSFTASPTTYDQPHAFSALRPSIRPATPPSAFRPSSHNMGSATSVSTSTSLSVTPPRPPRQRPLSGSPRRHSALALGNAHTSPSSLSSPPSGNERLSRRSDTSSSSGPSGTEDSSDDTRLFRTSTVTQKTASAVKKPSATSRSELGHVSFERKSAGKNFQSSRTDFSHDAKPSVANSRAPPHMSTTAKPLSVYHRQIGSLSTPALHTPRQTKSDQQSANHAVKRMERSDSDTSDDEIDAPSSDDNRPLGKLITRRPISRLSTSRTVQPMAAGGKASNPLRKPLVDLSATTSPWTSEAARATKKTPGIVRNVSIRSYRSVDDLHSGKNQVETANLHASTRKESAAKPTRSYRPLLTSSSTDPQLSGSRVSGSFPPPRPIRESPASSSNGGDSSSGMTPLTPKDGSELGVNRNHAAGGKARLGHQKRGSVTFAPSVTKDFLDKGAQLSHLESSESLQEVRRRERRRSEARNALELGKVVNGPPPVADSDEEDMNRHLGFGVNPMSQGMMSMPNFNDPWNTLSARQSMMNRTSMLSHPIQPYAMPTSSSATDLNFLAAHQQAMMIAKQTYQMAVAQQAIAAAGDEWERSSSVGGLSGTAGMLPWNGPVTLFPTAPQSMYAGSALGSSTSQAAWNTANSVYGENFGPSVNRQSMMKHPSHAPFNSGFNPAVSPCEGLDATITRQRQRAKTGPSSPAQTAPYANAMPGNAPPSSWKRV